MFRVLGHLPIYRSLPPMYRDVWHHFEWEKKNAPVDDGGKNRRTEFICMLASERDKRIEIINASLLNCGGDAMVEGVRNITLGSGRFSENAFEKLSDMFCGRLGKPAYLKLLVTTI